MKREEILAVAQKIVAGAGNVVIHMGVKGHWGIKITGCLKDEAAALGKEIELATGGEYKYAPGFACVWIR